MNLRSDRPGVEETFWTTLCSRQHCVMGLLGIKFPWPLEQWESAHS